MTNRHLEDLIAEFRSLKEYHDALMVKVRQVQIQMNDVLGQIDGMKS